jgi:hypothetical protein
MTKVANTKCRSYVTARLPFKGSNLNGEWVKPLTALRNETDKQQYVVYSYGQHFPVYVYSEGMWFENEDKYSRTTARHLSQARPTDKTILLSTRAMIALVVEGYNYLVKQRILTGDNYARGR